jgi:hypothetical protein
MLKLEAMVRSILFARSWINTQVAECTPLLVMVREVAVFVDLYVNQVVVEIAPRSQLGLQVRVL